MPGTTHIFFHDDVDGIISAALFLYNNEGVRYRLYPVTSTMRGDKFDTLIASIKKYKYDIKVILDYQYHSEANLWIDHHYNPTFGDCIIHNENIFYDPKSKSATRLVFKSGTSRYYNLDLVNEGIDMVDMIDSADYPNVEMAFKDKSPMMILRAYLERVYPSEMTYCRIIESIVNNKMDVKEALYRMKIGSESIRELEKAAFQVKDQMVVVGNISIINQKRRKQYPRYSEYLVMPEIKYSIKITPIGNDNVVIQIGFNQWQKSPNKINIGIDLLPIVKDYIITFGGHYNVGSGMVKAENLEQFIDDVTKILNEEEDMEKYGVDPTDPVEVRAAELVKEGSVKNIEEGRAETLKIHSKEKDDGSDGAAKK